MSKITEQIKITPLLDTLRLQKISDEVYFSERYKDYISNSRLGFVNPEQEGSMQKFLDGFAGNKIFSTSLDMGSFVHMLTLQPDLFQESPDIGKPTSKVGFAADELYHVVKHENRMPTDEEYYEAYKIVDYYKGNPSDKLFNENKEKIEPYLKARLELESQPQDKEFTPFLDTKNLEKAKGCVEALNKNSYIQKLLHPTGLITDPISENEQAILLDVEVECPDLPKFIVRLKSKLDNYTIDTESNVITVNDVKTIGRTLNYCEDQVLKYHYYRELSMYAFLLAQCSKKFYNLENPKVKGNFLWVSTIPGYYTKVTKMDSKLFKNGMDEFKELLRLAAIALYFKDAVQAEEYFNAL